MNAPVKKRKLQDKLFHDNGKRKKKSKAPTQEHEVEKYLEQIEAAKWFGNEDDELGPVLPPTVLSTLAFQDGRKRLTELEIFLRVVSHDILLMLVDATNVIFSQQKQKGKQKMECSEFQYRT